MRGVLQMSRIELSHYECCPAHTNTVVSSDTCNDRRHAMLVDLPVMVAGACKLCIHKYISYVQRTDMVCYCPVQNPGQRMKPMHIFHLHAP